MRPTFLIVLIVALCSLKAWTQTTKQGLVKGSIMDQESQQPLLDASVVLLHIKDSSLVASTFTDRNGNFILSRVPQGRYKLSVTYLGYQRIIQDIAITTQHSELDLGKLTLKKTGLTLAAVEIVKQKPPMVMKKDTLEFNADYFKTRENALMEELLKKLPGIQIGKDGSIKVNGVPVKKILVNGKHFFGDNPTMATRNLAAAIIDKVQLINIQADRMPSAAIYDDKAEQVINITIREDKKKRFLGQATVGYGTDDRFAVNGNLNRFTDEQQLSLLGSGNNVNGYHEGGGQALENGEGGIIRTWNGGVNYSRFFDKRFEVNGSYVVTSTHTDNQRNSARQNLLPDTTYYYNQDAVSTANSTNHELNLRMAFKPDSTQELVVMSKFNHMAGNNLQENIYTSLGGQHQLVNSGTLRNTNVSKTPGFSTAVFYEKKFSKPGRNIRTDLTINTDKGEQEGYNRSDNLFVQPNGDTYKDTINQRNDIGSQHRRVHYRLMYADSVFKRYAMGLAYIFTNNYTSSNKFTYDYNAAKRAYDRLNDSLSNDFENTSTSHLIYMDLRGKKGKYDYSIGMNLLFNQMNSYNISHQNELRQNWVNVYPALFLGYAITDHKRLGISYSGEISPPGIAALQPVPDNSNPLYIQLGNPELRPTFTHNIIAAYNVLNTQTMYSLSARAGISFLNNKIISASWFDSLGRQISRPLNVNGAYKIDANITNGFPLKKLQTFINANTSFSLNRDVSYMNGLKRNVKNLHVSQDLSFSYTYKELFDFTATASAHYNGVRYDLQKDNNVNFFNYSFAINGNVNLPLGLTIGGNLDYMLNAGRAAGYNLDATMLNLFISKGMFRQLCLIKLQGFDLLNQNVSISRNVGESYIEDVQTKVVRQFFMISFSYFMK